MRQSAWPVIVGDALLAALTLTALFGLSGTAAVAQDVVLIHMSPHAIILSENTGPVTVHVAIDYHAVMPGSVRLRSDRDPDAIAPFNTFADDRGELVAQFERETVKEIVEPITERITVEFTLSGKETDGGTFSGSDAVEVRLGT